MTDCKHKYVVRVENVLPITCGSCPFRYYQGDNYDLPPMCWISKVMVDPNAVERPKHCRLEAVTYETEKPDKKPSSTRKTKK